jgi:hypothetical protein
MEKTEIEALILSRLKSIEELKQLLETLAASLETALYQAIVKEYDNILENYARFYTVYSSFVDQRWTPYIQEVINAFVKVQALNVDYFRAIQVDRVEQITSIVTAKLYETYGLQPTGQVIKGGYIDSLLNATGPKQQIGQYLVREVISPRSKPVALRELQHSIQGGQQAAGLTAKRGAFRSFNDQFVYDRLQEADRISHNVYADELKLTAKLYIGALRETSRPFCRARAGKVFLNSEIKLFGTPNDPYGGYSVKSDGYFHGKPTVYNPFLSIGGYRCVHSWGAISNVTALRIREDLTEVGGVLQVK